jgi:hypothetical protein
MKRLFNICLLSLITSLAFSAPVITAKSSSFWKYKSTWNNRLPQIGDTIEIPEGITVTIDDDQRFNGDIYLIVKGRLIFTDNNSTLWMGENSVIEVINGMIKGSGSASQQIKLGNDIIYKGSYEAITGTQTATNKRGFLPVGGFVLPVRFTSFTAQIKESNVQLQWSTASEYNAKAFEVERSTTGNSWTKVGSVIAKGSANSINNYVFTDQSIGQAVSYRIKEVDNDGKSVYSTIQSVKAVVNDAVKIASAPNKILLQFAQHITTDVTVRIVSLNGTVVDEQKVARPTGNLVLNTSVKGNYIVAVSNAQLHIARQVVL